MNTVFPYESAASIPLIFALLFIVLFSIFYVRKYANYEDSIRTTTYTAIISLIIALLTSSILPIDIFIVSSMKYANGTFKEWAINSTIREQYENQIQLTYYTLYSIILMFIFLIIPFVYFYYEERDSSIFDRSPLLNASKNTFVFVLLAAFFLIIGAFVPLRPLPDPNINATWIDKFKNIIDILEKNQGEDALSMVLSILTAIGVTNVAIYTAYGMFSWPVNLIKGTLSARKQLQDIEDRHLNNSFNINSLREKLRTTGHLTEREMNRLRILEEQERITNLEESYVNEYRESYFYRLRFLLRPIQMIFGAIFLLISILVWISLLITNLDKAFHSMGIYMGYALINSTFINPMNFILSELQPFYPLDFIFVLIITFLLVMYTISGYKHIGVRFMCFMMYKIKPRKTAPQALLIMFASLMLALLGINVLFYSAFPQYSTYGRQFYEDFSSSNHTMIKICTLDSPKDSCTMTRMSALLIRFFYKAWFFGAYYYWMMWTFLIASLCSLIYVSLKPKQTFTQELLEPDFENEI